jgi:hypothetical protein
MAADDGAVAGDDADTNAGGQPITDPYLSGSARHET